MIKHVRGGIAVAAMTAVSLSGADPVSGQGTWETVLQARDLDGNLANGPEAFYDTSHDITWLRSASSSVMNWYGATTWASQVRFGLTGWRLPTLVDKGNDGPNWGYGGTDAGYYADGSKETGSEMAYLYYTLLGNKGYCALGDSVCSVAQPGWGLSNTGGFENLQPKDYWFGVEELPGSPFARSFYWSDGGQGGNSKTALLFALAVRDGDVFASNVPEPMSRGLMLAGLAVVGLATLRRKSFRRGAVKVPKACS